MPATPPPMPPSMPPPMPAVSGGSTGLTILLWISWILVVLVADFMAFMMFAFADSPGSAGAVKIMIVPVFIWFAITLVAGIFLLIFKGWWQIPLAYVLAISPPFMVFIGYNLFSGGSNSRTTINSANVQPAPPPVNRIGQTNFVPPPSTMPAHPDFQKMVDEIQRNATSQPKD